MHTVYIFHTRADQLKLTELIMAQDRTHEIGSDGFVITQKNPGKFTFQKRGDKKSRKFTVGVKGCQIWTACFPSVISQLLLENEIPFRVEYKKYRTKAALQADFEAETQSQIKKRGKDQS